MAVYEAYARARQAVLDAQDGDNSDGLRTAHEQLRAAEAPVRGLVDAAWKANVDTIQDARQMLQDATRERLQVELAVSAEARARNPVRPILNADELAQVEAAATAAEDAKARLAAARQRFKGGVTAEQLEAVD